VLGLQRGANVIMPNLTPARYRRLYEIYPEKACLSETADACRQGLAAGLQQLGREAGQGRGDAPHFVDRGDAAAAEGG
jgi:biotin synthase